MRFEYRRMDGLPPWLHIRVWRLDFWWYFDDDDAYRGSLNWIGARGQSGKTLHRWL